MLVPCERYVFQFDLYTTQFPIKCYFIADSAGTTASELVAQTSMPKAQSFTTGPKGESYIVSTAHMLSALGGRSSANYALFRLNGNSAVPLVQAGKRIAVDNSGRVWMVNDAGFVFYQTAAGSNE